MVIDGTEQACKFLRTFTPYAIAQAIRHDTVLRSVLVYGAVTITIVSVRKLGRSFYLNRTCMEKDLESGSQ